MYYLVPSHGESSLVENQHTTLRQDAIVHDVRVNCAQLPRQYASKISNFKLPIARQARALHLMPGTPTVGEEKG